MIVSEDILYFWYSNTSVSSVIIAFVIPSPGSLSRSNNFHHYYHFDETNLLNSVLKSSLHCACAWTWREAFASSIEVANISQNMFIVAVDKYG